MKKKEKKGLLILILVAILIIGSIWFMTRKNDTNDEENLSQTNTVYVQVQADGTKVNTSSKIKETRTIEGIVVENIRFTEKDGQTELVADITNTSNEGKERFLVDIVLYDTKGNEIGKIPGVIGTMQAGERIEMRAGITKADYIKAYDFKIVKK